MRRWVKLGLIGAGALVALMIAAVVVLQTGWFRDRVRERIIAELEAATGGRVEMGAFAFDWRRLTAEVKGLVIHGTEGAGEAPLFRARAIRVGLKVVSVVRREIDLQSLEVDTPQTHLIVYPDGRTNLPSPKLRKPRKDPVEAILNLAVKRFRVLNGGLQAGLENLAANVECEDLKAQVSYDARGPRYRGEVTLGRLNVGAWRGRTLLLNVEAKWALERNRLEVSRLKAAWNGSHLEARGTLADFRAARAEFEYTATVSVCDVAPLPGFAALRPRGTVNLEGRGTYQGTTGYAFSGRLKAAGLAIEQRGVRVENLSAAAAFEVTPQRLALREVAVSGLRGRLTGQAEVRGLRDFRVTAEAAGFSLEDLTRVPGAPRLSWSGKVSGPLELRGKFHRGEVRELEATARCTITRSEGPNPLEGEVEVAYSQRGGRVELGRSWLATPASRLEFTGTLGRRLEVRVHSKDLADFEPALALVSAETKRLPVRLAHGEARFQGVVAGPLENPEIRGRVAVSNLVYEGRTVERLEAGLTMTKDRTQVENLQVRQRRMRLSGTAQAGLRNWSPAVDQPISGSLTLQAPDMAELLAEAGQKLPVAGDLSATVTLTGTVGAPGGTARVTVVKGTAFEQPFERLEAQARYSEGLLEVLSAAVQLGGGRLEGKGVLRHAKQDLRRGELQFDLTAQRLRLERVRALQQGSPGLEGQLEGRLSGTLALAPDSARVRVLNGQVRLDGVGFEQMPRGSLLVTAATGGRALNLNLTGTLAGSAIHGVSQCTLEGDYPVQGTVEFSRLNFTALRARLGSQPPPPPLPFDGYLTGRVTFSGNLLEPPTWRAGIDLPAVEIAPRLANVRLPSGTDLSLRNRGPVRVDVDWKGATIRKAEWSGPDTEVSASGTVTFRSRAPWNLRLQGSVDLAALRTLDPELTSTGRLVLDAVFRGPLEKPEVFGRAEIQNGSLYVTGLPNGLDKINAVAFLYRDRATLDRFSAESGGGKVTVSGFVGFGAPFTYYLQARAEQVRYRDPTGASVTANAALSLTGTSERSVLGGEATLTRLSFNPQTDLGSLLAASAQPAPPPSQPGLFTQGIRFDVRVRTAPQARLETALTRGLQAEADLRLRGDPARPVVLGRVLVNQGEVLFFGNKYTIDSGEINFVNPGRIEPVVKLDLQTKVRGVDVTLTLNGPLNKMNVTYRSDPPLQLADIVGLLATGREPASAPGLVGARAAQSQSWEQAGASALMGQAIASPLAGRLQRFFGVSRLKIDPTISGTTGTPEARVTLEQQLSPTVTFTYITNLTRAEQQTVRVEWGLTKDWSAVALREENGLFGVDFLYKKRFK